MGHFAIVQSRSGPLGLATRGQVRLHLFGFHVSSTHPVLVAIFLAGALCAGLWLGRRWLRRPLTWAVLLSIAALVVAMEWGSTVAGGADSYGFVNQAGLWLRGQLFVQEEIIRQSPWPLAADTWTPLAFRPAATRPDAIVPLYPPGLPLLMALFQLAFGYCGAFLVVPLAAAMTVMLTYVLGHQIFGRPGIALWAALLVATSPVFLFQSMNPMTDVPVTAAWTLTLVLAIADRPLLAGLAMAVALLIRPNLVLVSAVIVGWAACRGARRAARVAAGVAPAVVVIAWINRHLFGSPLVSGYGSLDYLYSWRYAATNIVQFSTWMIATETPIVALALFFFVAPRLLPPWRISRPQLLLGGMMAAVIVSYLFYLPFGAWWYLRFLLPIWPPMMVLTAAGAIGGLQRWPDARRAALIVAIPALALRGIFVSRANGVFAFGRAERRYVDVARWVANRVEPQAVIVSLQHSGTIRHYAGRLTLRWDALDEVWLDRAVEYLQSVGRHPYLVLDREEIETFRRRFRTASRLGALDWTPIATLPDPYVAVFDPLNQSSGGLSAIIASTRDDPEAWECERPQTWPPSLRVK